MLEAARRVDEIGSLAKRSASMVSKFIKLYDHLCIKANAPLEDLLRFLVEEIEYDKYLEKTSGRGAGRQSDGQRRRIDHRCGGIRSPASRRWIARRISGTGRLGVGHRCLSRRPAIASR